MLISKSRSSYNTQEYLLQTTHVTSSQSPIFCPGVFVLYQTYIY